MQYPRGEILGQECVSCFIPINEIANFKLRDEDNATLILFVYPHKYSPRCTPQGIYDSVGYLFLSSFQHGVWRYQLIDERDKSLRFSCIYNQAQIINADFGRLIGNVKMYWL